jgi:ribosome biogenesis GTPase A
MSLQWFPGHMAQARRELAALMTSTDVVIEVLDARMPLSSGNPLVSEARKDTPCLKVLSKSDLADPKVTKAWLQRFTAEAGDYVRAIATSTDRAADARTLVLDTCAAFPSKRIGKPTRVVIAGIPNVGKSTLINTLMGRSVAVVSDRPAVTKQQQRVVLANGLVVTDTPGLMNPKIEDETAALRLAFGGAIPATAVDYETMALSVAPYLIERYPKLLEARFKLDALPPGAHALLEAIGKRRGFLGSGGSIDTHKAAEILVNEFRSGKLGRISLEHPA